jgi:uncharacterized OB-fold protein
MDMLEARRLQPEISPSPDAAPFWEAAANHTLLLPHCLDCDQPFFYPGVLCPTCGSRNLAWVEATGAGTLHSFCVHYHCPVPGLTDGVPFTTAMVDLAEGPRMMGFLVGASDDPGSITCDVPVIVEFLELDDGHTVLAFRPDSPSEP